MRVVIVNMQIIVLKMNNVMSFCIYMLYTYNVM